MTLPSAPRLPADIDEGARVVAGDEGARAVTSDEGVRAAGIGGPAPATDAHRGEQVAKRLLRAMTGPASAPPPLPTVPAADVRIGRLAGFEPDGTPCVSLPGAPAPLPARTVVALAPHHVGREVLVLREADGGAPVVTGLLRAPAPAAADALPPLPFEVEADGERVVLDARQQLVLRCGAASITLTREGKILLRGTYVSSRASGVHRIQGGSVEIN